MKVQNIAIGKIIPYDKNPRINTDTVKFLMRSIKDFGWRQPIVVDENMVVIAGHTRLLAGKELGCEVVPVHIATDLTARQVKALRLADNKIGEKSYWDMQLLQTELSELNTLDYNMQDFGFEKFEIGSAFDDTHISEEEFYDQEVPEVNMFSDSIKIQFESAKDLKEAQEYLGLTGKVKKIQWSQVKSLLGEYLDG